MTADPQICQRAHASATELKKPFVEKQPILVNTWPWSADTPIFQPTLEAGKKPHSIPKDYVGIEGVPLQ